MKAYQASACVSFADVQLVKESHLVKPRVNMRGDYTRAWLPEGVIHLKTLM